MCVVNTGLWLFEVLTALRWSYAHMNARGGAAA